MSCMSCRHSQEFKGDKASGGPITEYLRKHNPCPENPDPRGREAAAAAAHPCEGRVKGRGRQRIAWCHAPGASAN
jgi:hypothetical protein